MVNFRIYEKSSHFIPYEEIDWNSLGPIVLLGRFIREKSTGISYLVKRLSQSHIRNRGYMFSSSYHLIPEAISSFDLKTVLFGNASYKQSYSEPNLVTDIIFRNLNDYQSAIKELRIDQTFVMIIPYTFQIEPFIPRICRGFESLFNTSGISSYLYNPRN